MGKLKPWLGSRVTSIRVWQPSQCWGFWLIAFIEMPHKRVVWASAHDKSLINSLLVWLMDERVKRLKKWPVEVDKRRVRSMFSSVNSIKHHHHQIKNEQVATEQIHYGNFGKKSSSQSTQVGRQLSRGLEVELAGEHNLARVSLQSFNDRICNSLLLRWETSNSQRQSVKARKFILNEC